MPKRSSRDINETAFAVVQQATIAPPTKKTTSPAARSFKTSTKKVKIDMAASAAAVMLGRLGGLRGGKARAEKLSPERRKEIAAKASKARWANKH